MPRSNGRTWYLQDWTTIKGASFPSAALPVEGWADVGVYEHVFVFVEVRTLAATNCSPELIIESCHTLPGLMVPEPPGWFLPIGQVDSVGTTSFRAYRERPNSTSGTELGRYLRWRIDAPAIEPGPMDWMVCFRIWVNAQ
jgi:hypothetical protein